MTNIFRQLIAPWLLALLLAWLMIVGWLHSESRSQQQQQIQQLAITVNFALQANLPGSGEQQLANQLRQIHYSSPLAVQQIVAYNGQRQQIASSTSLTDVPVLDSTPLTYQVSSLADGSQLAVLPVSTGLTSEQNTLTGQLADNGYIAVVFNPEFTWLVWLIPLVLLTGALSLGLVLSVSSLRRGQLRQNTDIELLAHNLKRLQSSQQDCQISEPLVMPLRPLQQAFNELAVILDQRSLTNEQLVDQLNQRLQHVNSQSSELNQQRQQLTAAQQLQQRQIRHWLEQSWLLWQRKKQLQPLQQQRLWQMHLLAGHYQFKAADMKSETVKLAVWLGQYIDELNNLIPSESVMFDWQEYPANLAYSVSFSSQTLKSLLEALVMLGLRAEDVSKISISVQLQDSDEQHRLVLSASCNGNGLPAHCRQLIQSGDMLDLQWSDADIALLKAAQKTGATFSTQSLDGLGCILQLAVPVMIEPVSTARLLQQVLVFDEDAERLQKRCDALAGVAAQVIKCNKETELEQLIQSNVYQLVLLFLPATTDQQAWQSIAKFARQQPSVLSFAAPDVVIRWQSLMPKVLPNQQFCLARAITEAEQTLTTSDMQHILVVDDNETNLAFVQVLLKNKPLVLHTATSAEQVFLLCEQQRFDMILLDIQLPDMSGVDVAKRLRKMPHYHKIPIVAFTAHAVPAEINAYRQAGMDDIVFKPLEPARLDSLLVKFSLTPG